jgi:hypothetical protein
MRRCVEMGGPWHRESEDLQVRRILSVKLLKDPFYMRRCVEMYGTWHRVSEISSLS